MKKFEYGVAKAFANGEIKVGDRVNIVAGCWDSGRSDFIITGIKSSTISGYPYVTASKLGVGGGDNGCSCSDQDKPFTLVFEANGISQDKSVIKPMIQKITTFLKRQLDADTQALYEAGLINGNLELTTAGVQELQSINYFANKDALVVRAKEIIAEDEKKNTK